MSAGQLLRVRGVSKSFAGVHALHEVDFAIDAGEIVCLAGENGSGKSTLVKILAGVVTPDAGAIEVDGRARPAWAPIDAVRAGFEVIYQDFSLFPNLTVAENIAFNGQLSEGRRLVSWRAVRRTAEEGLSMVGVAAPLDALVEELSVADKQVVAIARALVQGARLIAMDEPTTALTEREVKSLLDVVRRLKADGVAVIFISHKLAEIFAVCERIVVLRNGVKVADGPASGFDMASLSQHMLGRRLEQHSSAHPREPGAELLRLEGFGRDGQFRDVSFSLRAGEVLGVTGLLGSGRTALAKALFGLAPADEGRMFVAGRPARVASPVDAIRLGIGYVPADRLTEGLFLPQSIARNVAVTSLDRLTDAAGVPVASANARLGRRVGAAPACRDAGRRPAGAEPIGRQPAARHAGAVAGPHAADFDSERTDRRGRRRIEGRHPRHHRGARGGGDGRDRDLGRHSRAARRMRSHPGHAIGPGDRGSRPGRRARERARGAARRVSGLAMRKLLARNETLVSLVLVAVCLAVALAEPSFLSLSTLFDLLRNGTVMALFAVGVLLVLASGGIDVSFTAIAAFAMYVGTKAMAAFGMGDSILVAFAVAGAIGLGLGLINGFFIATLKLPTLIVTLGTLNVFRGFLLTFVGTQLSRRCRWACERSRAPCSSA